MAILSVTETEIPVIDDTVSDAEDYKGRPVQRSTSGGWRSAAFVISVEVAERFAYYGISSNLITYLTGPLEQSTVTAAENVNAWSGTVMLLPLFGGFVADSFLGRFRTIIIASLLYILGLGLLTLSAILPSVKDSECQTNKVMSCSPKHQVILFFFSLYLVAFAVAGHKPCVQAFGADQFDSQDQKESRAKSSFFNWWYFTFNVGVLVSIFSVSYIQENLSWGLGFGIPCIAMVVALVIFLLGTTTYRFSLATGNKDNPFVRIGRVFAVACRNRKSIQSHIVTEDETYGTTLFQSSQQFKCLNKAFLVPEKLEKDDRICSIDEVEEAKAVLRLAPVWGTCLVYAIVFAQCSTFFTKQGATMDRTIVSGLEIPAASLQCFVCIAILVSIPIYDRILVPIAKAFTQKPSGITMLQRIGIGMFISALSMVVAAIVEMKRLNVVKEYDLFDLPNMTVPMSVWWMVPQYLLFGLADVFTMVGLQEFFYDQVPSELRSIGLALYYCIFGVGSFMSSLLVSIIEKATGGSDKSSWFSNNLNKAHLDYFYWLLAGLSVIGLIAYMYFARSYIYNKRSTR